MICLQINAFEYIFLIRSLAVSGKRREKIYLLKIRTAYIEIDCMIGYSRVFN